MSNICAVMPLFQQIILTTETNIEGISSEREIEDFLSDETTPIPNRDS